MKSSVKTFLFLQFLNLLSNYFPPLQFQVLKSKSFTVNPKKQWAYKSCQILMKTYSAAFPT